MNENRSNSASFDDVLKRLAAGESRQQARLPSVENVISIADDLQRLLFPGIAAEESKRTSSQVLYRKSLLNRIHARLSEEIEIAMIHSAANGPRLHSETANSLRQHAERCSSKFVSQLAEIRDRIQLDVKAAFQGDPAARTLDEILLCYPGVQAVMVYRFAHQLHRQNVPYLPRVLTEWAHRETGIDIHPGASIGPEFFIDHGTGVVIGETTVVGSGVTLYQGVTLGAWSFPRNENGDLIRGSKRHPTLEDNVTVYSNASILGGDTVVGARAQVGSGVTLSRSIPAGTIVTVERPSLRFREVA